MSRKQSKDIKDKDEKALSNSTRRNGNSGGKRKSTKPLDDKGRGDFICSNGKPTNDPRWYINNPVLSRDVGSIWFSKPIGAPLVPTTLRATLTSVSTDTRDPGIMAIPSIITWGGSNTYADETSVPINAMAMKLYQYVVHANSRNISYDQKDLMMTIMAISSIYATITEAVRAYRLIAHYDPENAYYAHLLTALHWNAADLRSKVAEFRYTINWAISRVNKFYVPALFNIVDAHMSAYEYVYVDRPSNKAQIIAKYSPGLWVYDDTHGALEYRRSIPISERTNPVNWSKLHTVEDFRVVIDQMITNVSNAQYLGVMQGDILKAFGESMLMQYAYVGIDMPLEPVYDEEFLLKLHNADLADNAFDETSSFWIKDGAGMIYRDTDSVDGNFEMLSGPILFNTQDETKFTLRSTLRNRYGTMLDLPTHIPASPENILLMTLYKLFNQSGAGARKWFVTDTTDTEGCRTGYLQPEILGKAAIMTQPGGSLTRVSSYVGNDSDIHTLPGIISRFRHHFALTASNTAIAEDFIPVWETDNVSPISMDMLKRCNYVILWSLWSSSVLVSEVSNTKNS